jgi:hypothetical protein
VSAFIGVEAALIMPSAATLRTNGYDKDESDNDSSWTEEADNASASGRPVSNFLQPFNHACGRARSNDRFPTKSDPSFVRRQHSAERD